MVAILYFWLEFGDNQINTFWVIQICIKIQDGISSHLFFEIYGFWWRLVGLKLLASCVPLKCLQNGVFAHFRDEKNFSIIFNPQKDHPCPLTGLFDVLRGKSVKWFWAFGCSLIEEPLAPIPQKYKKMPLEDEHVGYLPGNLCQFWTRFLQRFWKYSSPKLQASHWQAHVAYN